TPEHRPFAPPIAKNTWGTDTSHKVHWFPDLINKLNCVSGNNYENWMQSEGFKSHYLFDNATRCCETWYPGRPDCPDNERAVNPEIEDEPWHSQPYSMDNYYFLTSTKTIVDLVETTRHGWAINQQTGYYWTSYANDTANSDPIPIINGHTYYPDLASSTCVNGTNYPEWMASDIEFKRLYLFKTLDGCCEKWYKSINLDGCKSRVVQGTYDVAPCPINRPDCKNDPQISTPRSTD
ncbi:hypothetical protein ACHAWU_005987, partial [Discostella pseudostelligera]